jgi:hypothetical protein
VRGAEYPDERVCTWVLYIGYIRRYLGLS